MTQSAQNREDSGGLGAAQRAGIRRTVVIVVVFVVAVFAWTIIGKL